MEPPWQPLPLPTILRTSTTSTWDRYWRSHKFPAKIFTDHPAKGWSFYLRARKESAIKFCSKLRSLIYKLISMEVEMARYIQGIDVALWEPNIDWAKVRAQGIRF